MKIIYNKVLPLKGYKAMMLFGVIFARQELGRVDERTVVHETIHYRQQLELLFVGFFVWYVLEYLIRFVCSWDHDRSYKSISFEQEAYRNERDNTYLGKRKMFASFRLIAFYNKTL